MKYLFLDTNIYLHYIDVEQINWNEVVGDASITIVVPRITIQEIDQHKDQSRGKIQKRAKVISAKFAQAFLEGKALKYPFALCDEPAASSFDGGKFNIHINDDWFILSALQSNYDIADIVIISSDTNLLLKAKENGLIFRKMSDKYRLKEELSNEEKEIKTLKAELEKYKNRQPKPSIVFKEGNGSKLVLKRPNKRDIEDELSIYMENLKKEYPYWEKEKVRTSSNLLGLTLLVTQEQIDKHNTELDDYFKEEEEYQRFLLQKDILNERFKELSFGILNDGNAQTGDMNVFIEFPEDINLYNRDSKISIDDIAPVKPTSYGLDRKFLRSMEVEKYLRPFGNGIPQIYRWDIEQPIEKREFKFQYSNLNHNMIYYLDIKKSIYIDLENCNNFCIRWCIIDSELIDPVKGTLNVIIE